MADEIAATVSGRDRRPLGLAVGFSSRTAHDHRKQRGDRGGLARCRELESHFDIRTIRQMDGVDEANFALRQIHH